MRGRLAALSASLPEHETELEAEASGPGLRSIVECILTDSIEPAIRDLLAASKPEGEPAVVAARSRALPSDPAAAEALAGLAAEIAARLAPAEGSSEGRVRAVYMVADARRMGGDLAAAEQALSEATLFAVSTDDHAYLSRTLGLLRWEQGRTEEAATFLERAAGLFAGEGRREEEAACRVLRALLALDPGRGCVAISKLRDALPHRTPGAARPARVLRVHPLYWPCPLCGATAGEPCRNPENSRARLPHVERTEPSQGVLS